MRSKFLSAGLLAVSAFVASAHGSANLIHAYNLDGSYADELGGPSLTPDGGSLDANLYTFGANQGLNLSNALPNPANYTIEMNFEFDQVSGYRKMIDFKDLASDNGLYTQSTDFDFYNFSFSPTGVIAAGDFEHIVLTRDSSTNLVTGYVNGTQQIQFTDNAGDGVFSTPNNLIRFCEDDAPTNFREAASGSVDFIRIYDGALTGDEVAALPNTEGTAVPEPASLAGITIAMGALSLRRRRANA